MNDVCCCYFDGFCGIAEGAASVVRELQDCEKKKQQLEEEMVSAQSAITEVDGDVKEIRAKLRKLGYVHSPSAVNESNVRQQALDAESKVQELVRKDDCRRKPVYPPDCATFRLPDDLRSVALGRLVDLAFVEDETDARLISSHLGERVLSAIVFPTSQDVDSYQQAPHEDSPAALSLDVASQATKESIRDDLGEMDVEMSWKLACDCVSAHRSDIGCLINCLLKDTLITDNLTSSKAMLNLCRDGNDLRAVPDILSVDGYRVTAVGLVERLLDGRAESTFVFGQEPTRASDKYKKSKRTAELLTEMDLKMTELKTMKEKRKETVKRTKPLLDALSQRMILLEGQRRELEA